MISDFLVAVDEANVGYQTALLLLCLGLCWIYYRERPPLSAFAFVLAFTSSVALFNAFALVPKSDQLLRFIAFNLGVNWQLIVYLGLAVWLAIRHEPLPTKLMAAGVGALELLGAIISTHCNLLDDAESFDELAADIQAGASDYACGRVVSHAFEFLPAIVGAIVMGWVIYVFGRRRGA